MVDFRILCGGSRSVSRITTLDFRRANFGLFKDLLGGIPWVRALEGRSKRAGHYSSITSSMLRISASPWARNQAKQAGDLHGWARNFQKNSDGKERPMECGKRDGPLGRNTGMLSEYAGMERGRLRSNWN